MSSFAPLDVIQLLLHHDPEATMRIDNFGATPLHIACLNGTSPEIVKFIVEHDKGSSARILDNDDYSVLHHAVEYICLLIEKRMTFSSDSSLSIQTEHNAYMEIIQCLCYVVPEMVLQATKDSGDTPLDIAQIILSRQNEYSRHCKRIEEVYKILKKTSINLYSQKKKNWECIGYDKKKNCGNSIPSLQNSSQSSKTFNSKESHGKGKGTRKSLLDELAR